MPTRLNSRSLINVLPNLQPPSEVFRLGDIFNEATRGHYQSGATTKFLGYEIPRIFGVEARKISTLLGSARRNRCGPSLRHNAIPARIPGLQVVFRQLVPIRAGNAVQVVDRSEEHTSELQSPCNLVCRL